MLGEDCGCEERKQKLNKLFRYKTPRCLTESEYTRLTTFLESHDPNGLTKEHADLVTEIWNGVFQSRKIYRPCTCNPREWIKMVDDLKLVHQTYEENNH